LETLEESVLWNCNGVKLCDRLAIETFI